MKRVNPVTVMAMKAEKPESHTIQVRIEDLAFGGDGVARVEGKACFVPYTIPGELCRIRIRENRKNMMRGRLEEVLEPAAERCQPQCRVFGHCGGCQYQHLTYEAECRFKQNQVEQTMRRLGGLTSPPMRPLIPSPHAYGYRNRIQLHVEGDKVGFRAGDGRTLVPVRECPIASDEINHQLRKLKPDDLRGKIKLALSDAGTHDAGFSQVNRYQNEVLRHAVKTAMSGRGGRLIELYAGAGFFTEALQPQFDAVTAVEWDSRLMERGRQRCPEIDWVHSSVEDAVSRLKWSPTTGEQLSLLVDPPREGLSPAVLPYIMKSNAEVLVYLSCNPSTQARDLKALARRWQVESITPIDLFPKTAHIESLTVLSRSQGEH